MKTLRSLFLIVSVLLFSGGLSAQTTGHAIGLANYDGRVQEVEFPLGDCVVVEDADGFIWIYGTFRHRLVGDDWGGPMPEPGSFGCIIWSEVLLYWET